MQENRIFLAGSIAFVVGTLVGFAGAGLFSGSSAAGVEEVRPAVPLPRRDGEPAAGTDELAAALVELRLTLASLQGVIERTASAARDPSAGRTPVRTPDSLGDAHDLAESMDALAAALRALPAGRSAGGSDRGLVAPGWVDRKTAFDTEALKQVFRSDGDGEKADAAVKAWGSKHLFWTKQDILDRYGKPDDVYRDDDFIEWCYLLYGPGEEEDVDFAFDEGVVVGVDYSFNEVD